MKVKVRFRETVALWVLSPLNHKNYPSIRSAPALLDQMTGLIDFSKMRWESKILLGLERNLGWGKEREIYKKAHRE